MEWAAEFYGTTGGWWGAAESKLGERDELRVGLIERFRPPGRKRVLELGCGYGNTAAATARAGHEVVGIELSDRVAFAEAFLAEEYDPGSLEVLQADFYFVRIEAGVDVVTYWNGFGIGEDEDQRRLLRRISSEWLAPGGVAIVDICNPFVWASWDGDEEHLMPNPERGYEHELREQTHFDPVSNRATDIWWDVAQPDRRLSQTLRCYSPADLRLLLEGTGLQLSKVVVGAEELDLSSSHAGLHSLLQNEHEYRAILIHAPK